MPSFDPPELKKEKLSRADTVYPGDTDEPRSPEGEQAEEADGDRPLLPTSGQGMPPHLMLSEGAALGDGDAASQPWTLRRGGAGVGDSSQPESRPAAIGASRAPGSAAEPQQVDEDRGLSFDEIHRKYHVKIYNLILRMVGDREDAEDLTVITFTNAFRHWERFRGDSRVYTWLHQIAVNNCKNRFKQRDRRREREPVSLDDAIETDSGEMSREVADWSSAPERLLMDSELAVKIQEAVNALSEEYREVLILSEDDLSYEEIAQITGLSVPAVKTRLHRARLKVRQRLEPYYRGWMGRNG